jgi:crotonobetainyl-CoA:carnitine CoA-transferase CaiB-like acyl-CoA transferase
LRGLRVVEFGQYVAAPFAATLFADQGADVVKIERPGGDPYRAAPAHFCAWNRNKDCVQLDLNTQSGRHSALELVARADLVIENLRPGSMERLGLPLEAMRAESRDLVTCSISAFGARGPARDDPGWEPLVHARAGAQQGLFTGDTPIWLPFPMASIAAAFLAVLGSASALVKRESTGYGQHVETSLFDALLFLNAGPIFHRVRHRPNVVRASRFPLLHLYETRDGGAIQVNLSGTERLHELCDLVGIEGGGGLDFADPESLSQLSDRKWAANLLEELELRFAERTADEWEEAMQKTPAAASKCNTVSEWLAHDQAHESGLLESSDAPESAGARIVGPPIRMNTAVEGSPRARRQRYGSGALGGYRVVDISSFWAGPLAARLVAELGADVIKVEPPGGEGSYQLMSVLPNIYVDANRSKRGLVLDLRLERDRARLCDVVRVSDVVVENAVAGTWERLGLGESDLRNVNPNIVYARSKGFGVSGPLSKRPSFDYVVQAATGMEIVQGGGSPQPVNFTANDYGTGIQLAAGIALALLARARGASVTSVESSLMTTATVFLSEQVAEIAFSGKHADLVGDDLLGSEPGWRLYRVSDGWIVVCAAGTGHRRAMAEALGTDESGSSEIEVLLGSMSHRDALSRLAHKGVPAALSVHPSAVPDDAQVRDGTQLVNVSHPAAGEFVQVGIPLRLSDDVPSIRGPAPVPAAVVRRRRAGR